MSDELDPFRLLMSIRRKTEALEDAVAVQARATVHVELASKALRGAQSRLFEVAQVNVNAARELIEERRRHAEEEE